MRSLLSLRPSRRRAAGPPIFAESLTFEKEGSAVFQDQSLSPAEKVEAVQDQVDRLLVKWSTTWYGQSVAHISRSGPNAS